MQQWKSQTLDWDNIFINMRTNYILAGAVFSVIGLK